MSPLQDPLLGALADLRAALVEIGEPHMLIGGTAVILRGVARVTEDVDATVALAEDLVIYKTIAGRDRDRIDVERLLRTHVEDIDLSRVRRIIVEFAAALDEPERVEDFERLLARARGTRRG